MQAEIDGDEYGGRTIRKLLNTANFARLLVLASDSDTRDLIANDEGVARKAGLLYADFVDLVDYFQMRRHLVKGIAMPDVLDFFLSIRLSFSGRPVSEIWEEWLQLRAEIESELAQTEER